MKFFFENFVSSTTNSENINIFNKYFSNDFKWIFEDKKLLVRFNYLQKDKLLEKDPLDFYNGKDYIEIPYKIKTIIELFYQVQCPLIFKTETQSKIDNKFFKTPIAIQDYSLIISYSILMSFFAILLFITFYFFLKEEYSDLIARLTKSIFIIKKVSNFLQRENIFIQIVI